MINDYFQNIANSSPEVESREQVLGEHNLGIIAQLYKQYSNLFQLMEFDSLLKWQYKRDFNSDELRAFKEGLYALTAYMKACAQDVEKKNLEPKKKT